MPARLTRKGGSFAGQLILMLILTTGHALADAKVARFCSQEWKFYTEKDGSGLYRDLWREIFGASEIRIVPPANAVTWKRLYSLVDYEQELAHLIWELGYQDRISLHRNAIRGLKYHMLFTDSKKGRRLMAIWNEGMKRLNDKGRLKEMYGAIENYSY